MGRDWDYAWSRSEALQRSAAGGGLLAAISAAGFVERVLVPAGAMLACTAVFSLVRRRRRPFGGPARLEPEQCKYTLTLGSGGELVGRVTDNGLHHQPSLL